MTEAKTKLESKVLSSLEKVFPDSEFDRGPAYSNVLFEGARGETAAFQIAFRCTEGIYLTLRAESELPDISFPDIAGDRYETEIMRLARAGIVGGRPDGTYAPTDPLSRAEATVFITNILNAMKSSELPPSPRPVVE